MSKRSALRTLWRIYSKAKEHKLIIEVPDFALFKEHGRSLRLNDEAERKLSAVAHQPLKDIIVVMRDTGMRNVHRAGRHVPELKHMWNSAPDPNPNRKSDFPLKCWWTFRNDSKSTIDVTFWEFSGRALKVKLQAVSILQVQMLQQWLPADHGVPQVAVLPGQLFKGCV